MSRETEKVFSELHKFLDKHEVENLSENDTKKLIDEFLKGYNSAPQTEITEKTAKTAEDFLDLALNAPSNAKAVKYAKKAIALDPDNIDAAKTLIDLTAVDDFDRFKKLEKLYEKSLKYMEDNHFIPDDVGHFWGVFGTRPFMRMCFALFDCYVAFGMYGSAVTLGEYMLKLSKSDNIGVRYYLINLYAIMESEKKACSLFRKYHGENETQMLLAMAILYFRKNDFTKSEEYLRNLAKVNPDTKRFFKLMFSDDEFPESEVKNAYRPDTIEEFCYIMDGMSFVIQETPALFLWAKDVL